MYVNQDFNPAENLSYTVKPRNSGRQNSGKPRNSGQILAPNPLFSKKPSK